jgi:hypothetical protein
MQSCNEGRSDAAITHPAIQTGKSDGARRCEGGNSNTRVSPVTVRSAPAIVSKSEAVGLLLPWPNSRFNEPLALLVLLPTGSACHWKVCETAVLVPLLNAEAAKSIACELKPAADVAVPAVFREPGILIACGSVTGHISHTYSDHVSIPKFIEANWGLAPHPTCGALQVHVDYSFDRLHDSKLVQAYGIFEALELGYWRV